MNDDINKCEICGDGYPVQEHKDLGTKKKYYLCDKLQCFISKKKQKTNIIFSCPQCGSSITPEDNKCFKCNYIICTGCGE